MLKMPLKVLYIMALKKQKKSVHENRIKDPNTKAGKYKLRKS